MAYLLKHKLKRRKPVAGRQFGRIGGVAIVAASSLAGALLGGCSMTIPMGSLMPADETTGSLSPVPFASMLNEEDRRREKAALATALDPQGDGSTVHWENPKSGSKGAITAVATAYPSDGKICRVFIGEFHRDTLQRSIKGTACTVAAGEWELRTAKPFSKS